MPSAEPLVAEINTRAGSYLLAVPDVATDYIQGRVFTEGRPYEEEMLEDIARRVSPGDTVVDVGANVGNHTLYLARVVGCQVHAFEPSADLAQAISLSSELNGCAEQVHVHQVAVGAVGGVGSMVLDDAANLGAQRVVLGGAGTGQRVTVVALDDVRFDGAVAVLKIDVEGMEMDVLSGASEVLVSQHPLVYVECLDSDQLMRVEGFLGERGYVWGAVFNASPTHLFLHSSRLESPEALRDLLRARALEEHSMRTAATADRQALHEVNLRYRALSGGAEAGGSPQPDGHVGDQQPAPSAALSDDELDHLQKRVSAAESLRVEQATSHDELLRQLRVQGKEARKLKKRLTAERRTRRSEQLAASTRAADLEASLQQAQADLDDARRRRSRVRSDLRVVREHISEMHERLKRADDELDRSRAAQTTLEETVAAQEQAVSRQEAQLASMTKDIVALEATLAASQKSNKELVSDSKKVKADLKLRYSQVGAARRARDAFKLQLEELAAEHEKLRASSASERQGLQATVAGLEDALTAESEARAHAEDDLVELRKSNTYQLGLAVSNARSVAGLLKMAPSFKETWKNRATHDEA
jgi:FkbM family methyltransferase